MLYWFQQLLAWVETFLQVIWHALLSCFWCQATCCCRHSPTPAANFGFNMFAMNTYCASWSWICYNLYTADDPIYLYQNYTPIQVPPPPVSVKERHSLFDCGGSGGCCCCCCCGPNILHVQERLLRSLYCTFSGYHALHPSVLLGYVTCMYQRTSATRICSANLCSR